MRFIVMNTEDDVDFSKVDSSKFTLEDKWILTELNTLIEETTYNLDKYEFGIALQKTVDFIWDNYCDWYIEISKTRLFDKECETRLEAQYLLNYVLSVAMQILHPFMPFLTEEVYSNLIVVNHAESIMISDWPKVDEKTVFAEDAKMMRTLIDAIRSIRNIRKEMNVAASHKVNIIVVTPSGDVAKMFKDGKAFLQRLASVAELETRDSKEGIPSTAVAAMFDGGEIYIPLEDLIDINKELERLGKEKANLESEIKRLEGKLSNENFTSKAPEKIVNAEREKLEKYKNMYASLEERITTLKG